MMRLINSILKIDYNLGSVTDWKAVGGATIQGAITGASAGFTGGASLVTTGLVSGGANAVGGTLNRAVQGENTTVTKLITDATVGAAIGVGSKVIGNTVSNYTNNLSNAQKGKLGEKITSIKYGALGYKSLGKAPVSTGGKTPTGKAAEAKFDHNMKNMLTGKKLIVESKFNKSGLTKNQQAASKKLSPGTFVVDRTTSKGLGTFTKVATTNMVVGIDAQRNKKTN